MLRYFSTLEEMPMILSADHIAMFMGISRSSAYTLMHSQGFPLVRIGKRMLCPKDKFIQWLDAQVQEEEDGFLN